MKGLSRDHFFNEIVERVQRSRCGPNDVTILGGMCGSGDLEGFFGAWRFADMPYRIWEWTEGIVFAKDAPLKDAALLERGRLFGGGGDLMVRRHGETFQWRFVGPPGVRIPDGAAFGIGEVEDYWASHTGVVFHQYEETALLWGVWDGERWKESRVGGAALDYPVDHPMKGRRVQLHYRVFSRSGQVEFVWYTGLSEWRGSDNGERED